MKVQEVALSNIADKLVTKLALIKRSKAELEIRVDAEGRAVAESYIESATKTVDDLQEDFGQIKAIRLVSWTRLTDEDKSLVRKHAGV